MGSSLYDCLFCHFAACDDDKDFSYKGNLDLNLLSIKQARDLWDGTKCNVTTSIKQPLVGEEQKVDEFNYRLSLTLYQNRQATKDATVDLAIASDSLNKAIAMAGMSSAYAIYKDVELLPEGYYNFSANKVTLNAGEKQSEEVELNVDCSQLIKWVQNERGKSVTFVLPVQIQNSTSYGIMIRQTRLCFSLM